MSGIGPRSAANPWGGVVLNGSNTIGWQVLPGHNPDWSSGFVTLPPATVAPPLSGQATLTGTVGSFTLDHKAWMRAVAQQMYANAIAKAGNDNDARCTAWRAYQDCLTALDG